MAPKRTFVDLTRDDNPRIIENGRPQWGPLHPGLGTSFNPLCIDDGDEAEATQTGLFAGPMPWLYGALQTKIVGVRFYCGIALPGQIVIIQREPNNAHDRMLSFCMNCISVC